MSVIVYPKNKPTSIHSGRNYCAPPYLREDTPPPCCDSTPCCKPKEQFFARNAIKMQYGEVTRVFDLKGFDGSDFFAIDHCVDMELKRPGDSCYSIRIPSERVDEEGKVIFRWPREFTIAERGYWHARINVNRQSVLHVMLYKPFRMVNINSSGPEAFIIKNRSDTCYPPTSCRPPQMDEMTYTEIGRCGEMND